ncbi:MAG: hypothetical protein M0P17_01960 [Methanoculleus sp.]|nr:hypothetical protein [Methanoculleus sp.]
MREEGDGCSRYRHEAGGDNAETDPGIDRDHAKPGAPERILNLILRIKAGGYGASLRASARHGRTPPGPGMKELSKITAIGETTPKLTILPGFAIH